MFGRWRLFLTWMLMAAVPVQGFAAGAMLFCAAEVRDASGSSVQHGVSHEHGQAAHTHALAGTTTHDDASAAKSVLVDPQHQCSLCAACCHSCAISGPAVILKEPETSCAELHEPIVLALSHASSRPDKPPRF